MALQSQTVFPSAARTATPTAVEIDIADDVDTMELLIDTTAIGAAPSTVINIDFVTDTGAYVTVLSSAAIAAVGTARMVIGPGVVAAANQAIQAVLPKRIRVRPVHGNANSHTYSVAFRAR